MNNQSRKNQLIRALKMHQTGNINQADQIYIEILKNDESNFDANHLHGLVLSQKNKHFAIQKGNLFGQLARPWGSSGGPKRQRARS